MLVSSEERKKRYGLEAAVRDTSTPFSGLEVGCERELEYLLRVPQEKSCDHRKARLEKEQGCGRSIQRTI